MQPLYTWFDSNIYSWSHLKNRYKLVKSFRRRDPYVSGYPTIVYIETTNWCNFACPMCPTTIMTREKVNLELEIWKTAVDQLDPNLTELICMHSDGEPFLNKHIFEMIRYAKEKGHRLYTSTNASTLTEKNSLAIVESEFDVLNISLDSVSKEVYEKIRVGGTFEKTMENVHRFLEIKGSKKPTVLVQLIEMPENEHEVEAFLDYWEPYRKQGVVPVIKKMIDWFYEIPDIIDNYNWCDRPWFGMVVHASGDVSPCVHDYDAGYLLGNVRKDSLYDMWNNEHMTSLRKSITKGRRTNSLCNDCNYEPPVGHNVFVDSGLMIFDMCTVAKLIPRIGFRRARQYVSDKEPNRKLTKIKRHENPRDAAA